ncbi:MAG: tetratricopeptide repeat protein, partial [Myxococcales bacterium]|nr:tetratricopeptide repeat protein [Myxococcales bacterium]
MFSLLLGAATFVALPAFAGEPTEADRKEAKRLYAEARKLKADGKLDEAVERYRRAHELAPTPVTRLDLARALAEQSKLLEARGLVQSVPDMAVTKTETLKSKQARLEADSLARELTARIPTVALKGIADGQEVAIDGKPMSKELLSAPIALDPGPHVATVRVGEKTAETPFALNEREAKSIDLLLPPVEKPIDPPVEPPKKVDPPLEKPRPDPDPRPEKLEERSLSPAVPVLLSVGGATLLAGAISGGIALSQAGDLKDACAPSGSCPLS